MAYARIEDETIIVYQTLPQRYTFTDGSYTGNFADMPLAIHKAEGFLPFIDIRPSYDPLTEEVEYESDTVTEESITRNYVLVDIPAENIASAYAERLASAKAGKHTAINNYRETLVESGFTFDGHTYDTKPPSLLNISGTAARCLMVDLPDGFTWRDSANEDVVFTTEQFKAFAITASNFVYINHLKCRAHKDAVTALTSIADVNAYDYTTEW
jgi:hypothetical protein